MEHNPVDTYPGYRGGCIGTAAFDLSTMRTTDAKVTIVQPTVKSVAKMGVKNPIVCMSVGHDPRYPDAAGHSLMCTPALAI